MGKMKTHKVKIGNLQFSAAHFLVGKDFGVELLHGHNFAVEITFESNLDSEGLVVDFIKLLEFAKEIINKLDHKLLIPAQNPGIKISHNLDKLIITTEEMSLTLKKNNVVLIPFINTSAELIAEYFCSTFLQNMLDANEISDKCIIEVAVTEEPGCQGICRIQYQEDE